MTKCGKLQPLYIIISLSTWTCAPHAPKPDKQSRSLARLVCKEDLGNSEVLMMVYSNGVVVKWSDRESGICISSSSLKY